MPTSDHIAVVSLVKDVILVATRLAIPGNHEGRHIRLLPATPRHSSGQRFFLDECPTASSHLQEDTDRC